MTTDEPEPPGDSGDELRGLLSRLQRLVDPRNAVQAVGDQVGPAWQRVTGEEPRIQVSIAVLVAIGLMFTLPTRVRDPESLRWVLAGLAVLLLIGVFVTKSARFERRTRVLRFVSLALIAVLSFANAIFGARLVADFVQGEGIREPSELLLTGAAIWFTNVIVFGLWYWEFDRGGPLERAAGTSPFPDFLFPQMTSPEPRAARLGARLRRLPVRVVHERDRVQPDRHDAHDALDEADDARAVGDLRGHRRARDRPRRQHPEVARTAGPGSRS